MLWWTRFELGLKGGSEFMQLGRPCTNGSFSQAACHRARACSLLAASLGSLAEPFQTESIMWSRLKSKQLKGNPSALQRLRERAGTDISIAPLPFHSRKMTAMSLLSCTLIINTIESMHSSFKHTEPYFHGLTVKWFGPKPLHGTVALS